jgi:hypothetical protein
VRRRNRLDGLSNWQFASQRRLISVAIVAFLAGFGAVTAETT